MVFSCEPLEIGLTLIHLVFSNLAEMIKSVHVFLIEAAKSLMPSQPATSLNEEYLVVWFKFLVKKACPANNAYNYLMHRAL